VVSRLQIHAVQIVERQIASQCRLLVSTNPDWLPIIFLIHRLLDTPYEGKEFVNWPRYTLVRGTVVWAEGEITGKCGAGQYVKRGPSQLRHAPTSKAEDPRNVAGWLYD
jgi:hypothetical protein